MKYLLCFVVSLVCAMVLEQGQASTNIHETRFYKAEGRVDAGYLELAKDGTYRAIDREHMFVAVYEQGQWAQKGSVITFRPSTRMRGGKMLSVEGRFYHGTEIEYKGRTFLAFDKDDSAGIVIPVEETKKQLDREPQSIPELVFFKISASVFAAETQKTYPFHYYTPDN